MAVPSGTVTFLFTDVEGSTRLWQQDEAAMRAALFLHDELLRSAVVEQGGTVFSTMGDGVAAAFPAASAAVRAALSAQQLIQSEAWPTATPLRVRMGLHTGEAELRDGDYFGTAVNRAARLMAVAHGGQIVCSSATAGVVESEAALVDLGEHRLRDLDRPIRVFQVGAGSFAPLRSLDVLPGNLPSLTSSFVGRHEELAAVAKELGAVRLVTLTGVGGVGKTRLALQVAAEVLPGFGDGAWVCELAAAASGEEMTQVIATALGVVQRQQMTLAESIVDFLRTRQILVVLDNCEHLLDAAAGLAEMILAGAPGVRILATSREGFGIGGEHVRPLRSLGLPADVREALSSDAVALFVERAREVEPDFVLDDATISSVAEICVRLDGIPLAIELAAARVAGMGPAEIAGHLDERFRLLTGGRRGRVERHQTLRAAIEWSYSLLTGAERTVFDRLGVFPASFDETAAVAVCGFEGIERWDVIDGLSSLAAKSMVGLERSGDAARYQLLETLRHFARDRAGTSGDLEGLRRRHATHYAGFAEHVGAGIMSPEELAWRGRLVAETDNLRAAAAWALDAAALDDVTLGLRIISGLIGELQLRPSAGIQAWARPAFPRVAHLDPNQRALVLAVAAHDALYLGQFDRAQALGQKAISESTSFSPALVLAVAAEGLSALFAGDAARGQAVFAEGRRRLPVNEVEPWLECVLHFEGFWMAYISGDLDTARAEDVRALSSARRGGTPSLLAGALAIRARMLFEEDPDEALAAAEESIRLVEAGAADWAYSPALQVPALLRSARGDGVGAARALLTAVEYQARVGNRVQMSIDLAVAVLVLASSEDTFEPAATLAGAISGPTLRHLPGLDDSDGRKRYSRTLATVAAYLGTEAYSAAQQSGASMTYDEIVAYTLERLDRLAGPSAEADR